MENVLVEKENEEKMNVAFRFSLPHAIKTLGDLPKKPTFVTHNGFAFKRG